MAADRRLLISFANNLEAINAANGQLITSFGNGGTVNLKEGLGRDANSMRQIQSGTPGVVFEDLIILGSSTGEDYGSPPGDIRAYDVRTGRMAWIFHTIPHPGEPGYETWPKDAWKSAGGVNCWGEMSLDEKTGIVYIPTGAPVYDFYGADRKGNDLFADSLLALNAHSGKLVWYYQLIHHDLWDYDAMAAPQLLTVQQNGKDIPIVAQASKQGFVYVFNRTTGKPVWPIEERAVPASQHAGRGGFSHSALSHRPTALRPPGVHRGRSESLYPEPARSSALEEGGGECGQPWPIHPSRADRYR